MATPQSTLGRIETVMEAVNETFPALAQALAIGADDLWQAAHTGNAPSLMRLRALADEAEQVHAALILGLACTPTGNSIPDPTFDVVAINPDDSGAIRALVEGKGGSL